MIGYVWVRVSRIGKYRYILTQRQRQGQGNTDTDIGTDK
jgi:hypothetical protein